ncbi:bifunctional glutamate N-acetyltransferase/amino-acid acetyltransferase ArgJ [Thiohalorhabdus sp.]|uniref:bifunctional glutamate N-acetyltransferase/amino-acid acetyltransferase ArgJ n=1 Tax=Thiohalorhabdus sp. TaxID=3094134 RepID=UPI002FC315EC
MAVGPGMPADLASVRGVRLGVTAAGIRKTDHDDLILMELPPGSRTAAVFTRNGLRAAPVWVAQEHLLAGQPRLLVINTGSANAATGDAGMQTARAVCAAAAELAELNPAEVLPFSTGVIGEPLPLAPFEAGLPACYEDLKADAENWWHAAEAIRTTDTRSKAASRTVALDGEPVTVTGIAKGSGMIHPNMATMLAFVTTDAAVAEEPLQAILATATEATFNRISVDGDTSTNDALTLSATGAAGTDPIHSATDPRLPALREAVTGVCRDLALAIVRDGEGATRLLTIGVTGAADAGEAVRVAQAIARSPLVKTAAFAGDPNWGRILAAAGSALKGEVDWSRVDLHLGEVRVVRGGVVDPTYTEVAGAAAMAPEEVAVTLELGRGDAADWIWTCDLSYEYVTINAEYRS